MDVESGLSVVVGHWYIFAGHHTSTIPQLMLSHIRVCNCAVKGWKLLYVPVPLALPLGIYLFIPSTKVNLNLSHTLPTVECKGSRILSL